MDAPARDLTDDVQFAGLLASTACRLLEDLRASGIYEGRALGDAGDRVANAFLVHALGVHRPDDGLLSEEEADNTARLSKSRVWIVDPLDGTREYSEGRTDWAVHVALAIDGVPGPCAVGQVMGVLTTANAHLPARYDGPPRLVVSRTRPPTVAQAAADALGGVLLPMGSAGAKVMAVVRGEAEAYVHAGGMYEWDNCAPAGVAAAAGLHVSRIDGSPMRFNAENPYLPDLIICRPDLADTILAAV